MSNQALHTADRTWFTIPGDDLTVFQVRRKFNLYGVRHVLGQSKDGLDTIIVPAHTCEWVYPTDIPNL